jgi:hypothetical protein
VWHGLGFQIQNNIGFSEFMDTGDWHVFEGLYSGIVSGYERVMRKVIYLKTRFQQEVLDDRNVNIGGLWWKRVGSASISEDCHVDVVVVGLFDSPRVLVRIELVGTM